MNSPHKSGLIVAVTLALSACATTAPDQAVNPRDPYEKFNRAVFDFNDKLDEVALKPVAKAYQTITPSFVQTGIGNFFGNIGDVWNAANNLLQGKVYDGMNDVMRVALNSTFGFGGVLDLGSAVGLPKHKEDFGQTLGVWGVKPGPYIVLPLLGPTNVRDTVALPLDYYGDLWSYYKPVYIRNSGSVVRVVDKRASILDAGNLLEDAALDKYIFVRDAYMQRRESEIHSKDDD